MVSESATSGYGEDTFPRIDLRGDAARETRVTRDTLRYASNRPVAMGGIMTGDARGLVATACVHHNTTVR